jgi:hypothetical protein
MIKENRRKNAGKEIVKKKEIKIGEKNTRKWKS